MPAGNLGKERALRQQHERESAVEGAQGHQQVHSCQRIARPIAPAPPREPGQEEGDSVERGAVRNGQAPATAACPAARVLLGTVEGDK